MNTTNALADAETLIVHGRRIARLREQAVDMPSIPLDERALRDLELLLNRGYYPLCGYAGREEYESVLDTMRLPGGTLWPTPVTLAAPAEIARRLPPGGMAALRDREGFMLAVVRVSETFVPDLRREALALFGTDDPARHPGVARLFSRQGMHYVAGGVEGLSLPQRYDFTHLRRTPAKTHRLFAERGWKRIIAYQDTAPLHRMHRDMLLALAAEQGARLFISPIITPSPFTEVGYFSTVRCYEHFLRRLPPEAALLGLTPLYTLGAGPRGAMLHAIVSRNHGCTHMFFNERHDDPFPDGDPFYPAWAAYEAVSAASEDLEIVPVQARPRRYIPEFSLFMDPAEIKPGIASLAAGHAALEDRLARGEPAPDWLSFPEVLRELSRLRPPASRLGFTLFLTGLSGAGKSTLAKVLYVKLMECQDRPVSLLDGDIVRRHLSSELSFSKEHRNLNVQRIGFVAGEITKNRGIALCAPIAPYPESRRQVREMVSPWGAFIEIHMSTPLAVCEQRDRKGLYARARAGVIHGVTGVDDPYLPPENPELRIDTTLCSPLEAAEIVLDYLKSRQLIGCGGETPPGEPPGE
jgi:sulfate adenylyltransferase